MTHPLIDCRLAGSPAGFVSPHMQQMPAPVEGVCLAVEGRSALLLCDDQTLAYLDLHGARLVSRPGHTRTDIVAFLKENAQIPSGRGL